MKIRFIFLFLICTAARAQSTDSVTIRKIFDTALTEGKSYHHLGVLCREAPARLSGSRNAGIAVELTRKMLEENGIDVWLQECMVTHWERGKQEVLRVTGPKEHRNVSLKICALGSSVGTPKGGITAGVVMVDSLAQLQRMGEGRIKGKIVFFNRPMDPRFIDTFHSYGACADQRVWGADEAAKYGAVAVLVRSLGLRDDDFPHTGVMIYKSGIQIPGAAISTNGAEKLKEMLLHSPDLQLHLEMSCQSFPDTLSYNVIGEIRGSEHPDEIIVVGGHLDSWDNGEGAHDDGAGVVQSIEVLYLFKKLGIQPKRTIRCVLFMNEENGSKGARKYAEESKRKGEKHIVAIESDRGGLAPRGFSVEGINGIDTVCMQRLQQWAPLFAPYLVHWFEYGGSGVDVSKLKDQGTALLGFIPDPQRYFDVHHTADDKFIHVNKRELELGGATMAALVYLFSEHGLPAQ